jgi:hypothetical protein
MFSARTYHLATHRMIILVVVLMLAASCKKTQPMAVTREPLRERGAGFLLKRYERNEFNFDWLGMKIDAEFLRLGETQGFKANVRMKKDSIIWISISPALGIEVFRVRITPDSLQYVSKIPDNKYYYSGPYEALNDIVHTDLDFEMLQEIFVGNAIGLEKDEGKFRTEVDDDKYLLISKYKRRVRRVVGMDDRKLDPNDTIVVNPNDRRYQRAVRKKEDDLIVSRYWLESDNFRLVRSIFDDLLRQRTVKIEYSEFNTNGQEESMQVYPSKCKLNIRDAQGETLVEYKITKLVLNKPYETALDIPEDFERRLNP